LPGTHASPTAGSTSTPARYATTADEGDDVPAWFRDAEPPTGSGAVDVRGATIRYLTWGPERGPATVLVHGGGAHAQWWAPLARLIEPIGRVVAMDFSGHGLSDRRDVYALAHWTEEVVAVCRAVSDGPATVVAHSFGGIVSTFAATGSHGAFARVIGVDAPVWPGTPEPPQVMPAPAPGRAERTYPDLASALARFRLVPPQPCANDWYLRHVARHSLHAVSGGWQWRFDPRVFARSTGARSLARFDDELTAVRCPLGLVIGADSYLAPSAHRAHSEGKLAVPHRFVPNAGHHVMLDEPLALVAQIRRLLADPRLQP